MAFDHNSRLSAGAAEDDDLDWGVDEDSPSASRESGVDEADLVDEDEADDVEDVAAKGDESTDDLSVFDFLGNRESPADDDDEEDEDELSRISAPLSVPPRSVPPPPSMPPRSVPSRSVPPPPSVPSPSKRPMAPPPPPPPSMRPPPPPPAPLGASDGEDVEFDADAPELPPPPSLRVGAPESLPPSVRAALDEEESEEAATPLQGPEAPSYSSTGTLPSLPPPPNPPGLGAKAPDSDWGDENEATSVFDEKGDPERRPLNAAPPPSTSLDAKPRPAPAVALRPELRPESPQKGSGALYVGIAAVALVAISGLAYAFWPPATGELNVNIAGPGNTLVESVEVSVDDQVVCTESPCRMPELEAGSHALSIVAEGYKPTAKRVVSVRGGQVETINIELLPVEDQAVARAGEGAEDQAPKDEARSSSSDEEDIPTLDLDAEDQAADDESDKDEEAEEPASKPVAKVQAKPAVRRSTSRKATGKGRISISSVPSANVVLDGKPLGSTPKSVSVAPGLHTVLFIHPQKGRRQVTVRVTSGATAVAAARF